MQLNYKITYSLAMLLFLGMLPSKHSFSQNVPELSQTAPSGNPTGIINQPPEAETSFPVNRVNTFIPRVPIQSPYGVTLYTADADVHKITAFKDGFNRTFQVLNKDVARSSNTLKDLVTVMDSRSQADDYTFLPYSVNSALNNPTLYRTNAFAEQKSFYQAQYPDEQYTAYNAQKYFSNASLRQMRNYHSGKSQVGEGHGVNDTRVSNSANQVRLWTINSNGMPESDDYYAENTLFGDSIADQEGKVAITFKGMKGNVLLKEISDSSYLQSVGDIVLTFYTFQKTYYVYDAMNRLRYTLTPKAVEASPNGVVSAETLNNLCFQFHYDSKGRMSAKRKPGEAGFTYIVYDQKGRQVMLQTPNDSLKHQWKVTFYDKFGRITATSIYASTASRTDEQELFDDYSGGTYPTSDIRYYLLTEDGEGQYPPENGINGNVIMSYNYYDDYTRSDPANQLFIGCVSTVNFTETLNTPGAETPTPGSRFQGLLTGSKVRILPAPEADTAKTGEWRQSALYYDDKGRIIYTATLDLYHDAPIHKHYTGTQYNFSNQVLISKHVAINLNSADGNTSHTELTKNIYDPVTQSLRETDHSMDGSPWNILVKYEYDDLGRVKRQVLGNYGEVRDYDYNIWGQVTGINGHYAETGEKQGESRTFGESLKYDYGFSQPRYDGEIAGMIWRGSGGNMQAYGYNYDKNGRLSSADYRQYRQMPSSLYQWDNSIDDRSVSNLIYDKGGNIQSMTQRGTAITQGTQHGVDIDHMSYSYAANSNQLMSVTDTVSTDYGVGDFQDGHTQGADYAYDANGNLIQDLNKGITGITYNSFNKPQTISFSNGNVISYTYTAGGARVEEIAKTATIKRTDYTGNFVYQNDSVQYASTAVGRTVWQNDTAKEEFFVKDHLGNVRSVVDVYHYPLLAYLATYEVASAQLENLFFDDVDGVRDDKPGSTDPSDTKAGRLNGADPDRRVGTSLLLKVMAGDKVQLKVNSYYEGYDATQDVPVDGEQMLESIVSTLTGGEGGLGESESHDPGLVDKLFNPENYANAADILQENADPSKPKAFLNYILFNSDMQVVGSFTGAFQATGDGDWTEIGTQEPLLIPESGYLAVYLSNSTAIPCDGDCVDGVSPLGDVFFDQLQVRFTRGKLKEEAHYYPFGLPMGDIGSAAVGFTQNRQKYQTNAYIKDAGLNWMNFHARQYDPQIGRFMGVDPLAGYGDQDRFSSYAAMWDEPAGIVDPAGLGLYDTNMLNTIHITAKRPPTPEPNWGAPNWQGEGGMNIHWGGGYGHIHPGGGSAGGASSGAFSSNMGAGTTEQLMPSPDQIRQLAKSFMDPPTKPGETGYETNFKGTIGETGNGIYATNLPSNASTMLGTPIDQTAFGQGMNEFFIDISPLGLINIPLKYATGTSLLGNRVSMSPFEAIVPVIGNIGGTTVFRAVDAVEAASIESTGRFLLKEGGTEVKYFSRSIEDANWYGSRLYPNGYTIIKGNTSISLNNFWYPHTDIGAYAIPEDILRYINPIQ